jgi:hypothetical protein
LGLNQLYFSVARNKLKQHYHYTTMKSSFFLLLFTLPQFLTAQINILIPVAQNPEFGFSMTKSDTTIEKGGTAKLGSGLTISGGAGGTIYLWAPAATLSNPAVLNPVASPTDTTDYILTATDKNGCSFSVKYRVNVKKSVVKSDLILTNESLRASIFPNPGNGEFKVQLRGSPQKRIDLLIFDNEAKLIQQKIIWNFEGEHTESIGLTLSKGIYTLRIIYGDNTLSRLFVIN